MLIVVPRETTSLSLNLRIPPRFVFSTIRDHEVTLRAIECSRRVLEWAICEINSVSISHHRPQSLLEVYWSSIFVLPTKTGVRSSISLPFIFPNPKSTGVIRENGRFRLFIAFDCLGSLLRWTPVSSSSSIQCAFQTFYQAQDSYVPPNP